MSRGVLFFLRAALLFLVTLCVLPSAYAADHTHRGEPRSVRDHTMLGVKGVSLLEEARAHGRDLTLSGYGIAGVAERTFFHDHVSLELDLVFSAPGDERSFATEPLAKLPWHLRPWFEPYAAAGPMFLSVRDGHGERYLLGGGQLVVGAFLWFAAAMGLDIDIALGAARGPTMSMIEATFAVGPVLRN